MSHPSDITYSPLGLSAANLAGVELDVDDVVIVFEVHDGVTAIYKATAAMGTDPSDRHFERVGQAATFDTLQWLINQYVTDPAYAFEHVAFDAWTSAALMTIEVPEKTMWGVYRSARTVLPEQHMEFVEELAWRWAINSGDLLGLTG